MGGDDEQLIRAEHVIDAALIGLLVYCAVILGDILPALFAGQGTYLTWADISVRTPTGVIGGVLAFVFQWLRARGIDVIAAYRRFKDAMP